VSLLTPQASEREASAWEQRMTGQNTT
jgi:hypothetical protein